MVRTNEKEIAKILKIEDKGQIKINYSWDEKTLDATYKICVEDKIIAYWHVIQMPGCCAIGVFTGAYVDQKYRNMGLGHFLFKLAIDKARNAKYATLMATDVTHNFSTQRLFETTGWKEIHKVENRKTSNEVGVYLISL